jgi:hypothetical protein
MIRETVLLDEVRMARSSAAHDRAHSEPTGQSKYG